MSKKTDFSHLIPSEIENTLAQFMGIIEHLPAYVYWKNKASQYMGCNLNVAKLVGFKTPADIVGKTDEDLPWGSWQAIDYVNIDQEVMRTGAKNITVSKLPLKRSDGNYIYLKTEKVPLRDKSGEVQGVFGIAMDITDEKLREHALLKEEQDSIIANMPGYIYWKNKNSEYMGCNNNLAKISGLNDRSEIVGKTDYDFEWGKEQADQFVKDDREVMRTGETLVTEYKLPVKKADGHHLYVRTDKMPLYGKDGEVIGVLAVAIDMTDERIAEEKTHIAHTFVEDILYNLPGLIYWKNKKSQYVGFNKNVLMLSGLSREELLGKTDKELNWGKSEAESFQEDDQQVMETGQIKVTEYEIPIKRPDGNNMIVRTEKSRLFDRQGCVVGVLGVAIDITDQKILEKKLEEQRDKAETANQVKTEFIQNMEHDIRTPFNGVWGMANILWKKETDEKKKEWLRSISDCAKELLDYCNGILDFSKIESQEHLLVEKKFDLYDLLLDVLKIEIPPAKIKNLSLKKHYDASLPKYVLGDRSRIYRILLNLTSNAIKFTDKGGEVSIEFKLVKSDLKQVVVQFMVADTGIGIPLDKQEYIYEKFSKLSPSNKGLYKGIGVGLTIVKQLIAEMEGEIEVISEVGNGSKFICLIPMKRPLIES